MDEKHERIRKAAERMKQCAEHDSCEKVDCAYYLTPEMMKELAEFVEDVLRFVEDVLREDAEREDR